MAKKPKRLKYGNKKVVVDGITFDSKKEAARYGELKMLERAGDIQGLHTQKRYSIDINGTHICNYIADFVYYSQAHKDLVVEDVKSEATRKNAVYRLKKKLMKAVYHIDLKEF